MPDPKQDSPGRPHTGADDELLDELESMLGIDDAMLPQLGVAHVAEDQAAEDSALFIVALDAPPIVTSLAELDASWPTIEAGVLPQWHVADVVAMITAGVAGAFTSAALTKTFAGLDKDFSRQQQGESIDRVPGEGAAGGWFHRLKYGHDLFNPFEVDWAKYAPQKGLDSFAKAFWPWVRHLLQDTFSREGLPLPGSSYLLRKLLINTFEVQYETYRTLFTLKARDAVGAVLTTAMIEAWVFGSARAEGRREQVRSYRHWGLLAGAHLVSIGIGLMQPNPSLNYASVAAAGVSGAKLMALVREVDAVLARRDAALRGRQDSLDDADRKIHAQEGALLAHAARIEDFQRGLDASLLVLRGVEGEYRSLLMDAAEEGQSLNRFLAMLEGRSGTAEERVA